MGRQQRSPPFADEATVERFDDEGTLPEVTVPERLPNFGEDATELDFGLDAAALDTTTGPIIHPAVERTEPTVVPEDQTLPGADSVVLRGTSEKASDVSFSPRPPEFSDSTELDFNFEANAVADQLLAPAAIRSVSEPVSLLAPPPKTMEIEEPPIELGSDAFIFLEYDEDVSPPAGPTAPIAIPHPPPKARPHERRIISLRDTPQPPPSSSDAMPHGHGPPVGAPRLRPAVRPLFIVAFIVVLCAAAWISSAGIEHFLAARRAGSADQR